MSRTVELIFKLRAENAQQLDGINNVFKTLTGSIAGSNQQLSALDSYIDRITLRFRGASGEAQKFGDSLTGNMFRADLMAQSFMRAAGAVKAYTIEAAEYSARTQQLAVVADSLARVNRMSGDGVRLQERLVQAQGITQQESLSTVARMIQARLNVGQASDLARVAQDAAKIGGTNSSDALERITTSIATAMVRPLHTLGMPVSFETAYQRYAAEHGMKKADMSEAERSQARLNEVLRAGVGIAGTWEASQATAAGQMQSLRRYADDLKGALGEGLQPVIFRLSTGMRDLARMAQEDSDSFRQATAAAAGLTAGVGVFAATGFLPLPARAAAALFGAGVGASVAKSLHDNGIGERYADSQRELERKFALGQSLAQAGLIDRPTYQALVDRQPKMLEVLKAQALTEYATLYRQRRAQGVNIWDTGTPGTWFGTATSMLDPTNSWGLSGIAGGRAPAIPATSGPFGFSRQQILDRIWAMDHPQPGGNLMPLALQDDDALKNTAEQVASLLKSARTQLEHAKLALLPASMRPETEYQFARGALAEQIAKLPAEGTARAQASAGYGMLAQVRDLAQRKSALDYTLSVQKSQAEYSVRLLEFDKKDEGDLDTLAKIRDAEIQAAQDRYATQERINKGSGDVAAMIEAEVAAMQKYQFAVQGAHRFNDRRDTDRRIKWNTDTLGSQETSALTWLRFSLGGRGQEQSLIDQTASVKKYYATQRFVASAKGEDDYSSLRQAISKADEDREVSTAERLKRLVEETRNLKLQGAKSAAEYEAQLFSLTVGRTNPLAAIEFSYRKQVQFAQQQYDITRRKDEYDLAMQDAIQKRNLAIAQERNQQLSNYRNLTQGMFQAMVAGGSGFPNFLKQQALTIGGQVSGNVGEEMFKRFGSTMGSIGQKSGLPAWLLQGTMVDPANKALFAATKQDLAADKMLMAGNAMLSATGTGYIPGSPASGGGVGNGVAALLKWAGSASGSTPLSAIGVAGAAGTLAALLGRNVSQSAAGYTGVGGALTIDQMLSPSMSFSPEILQQVPSLGQTGPAGRMQAMRAMGYAAGATAAMFGAFSGFKAGGAQGYLQGAGSIMGGLAMIPGPQQPFMMGAALVSGLVAALFGDPRKKFDAAVNDALKRNKYTAPDAKDYTLDTSGQEVSYNQRGRLRPAASNTVVLQVQALDAQSVIDRQLDICEAVRQGLNADGPLRSQIADVARYS